MLCNWRWFLASFISWDCHSLFASARRSIAPLIIQYRVAPLVVVSSFVVMGDGGATVAVAGVPGVSVDLADSAEEGRAETIGRFLPRAANSARTSVRFACSAYVVVSLIDWSFVIHKLAVPRLSSSIAADIATSEEPIL